jgi:hypothetical protein
MYRYSGTSGTLNVVFFGDQRNMPNVTVIPQYGNVPHYFAPEHVPLPEPPRPTFSSRDKLKRGHQSATSVWQKSSKLVPLRFLWPKIAPRIMITDASVSRWTSRNYILPTDASVIMMHGAVFGHRNRSDTNLLDFYHMRGLARIRTQERQVWIAFVCKQFAGLL